MQRNRCGHCYLLSIGYASSAFLFWAPSSSSVVTNWKTLELGLDNMDDFLLQHPVVANSLIFRQDGVRIAVSSSHQPLESKCNVGVQVWSRVCRNLLRPHHAVPAAGERRGGRHLPGGQDDQSHEARSLHWYSESSSVLSLLWRSSLFCHITTTLWLVWIINTPLSLK